MHPNRCATVVVIIILAAGCASNRVSIYEENDSFAYGPPTDANYTQGLLVTVQPDEYKPCAVADCNRWQRGIDAGNFLRSGKYDHVDIEYGVGQQMYTPNQLDIDALQEDDRPYAGWLFGTLKFKNAYLNPSERLWQGDSLRSVRYDLGIIGPSSQADSTQKWWHRVCGCTDPTWAGQLRDEPGFAIRIAQEDRLFHQPLGRSWGFDLLSKLEAGLGNVYTGAEVSGTVRIGFNLPRVFGVYSIAPLFDRPLENSKPDFHAFVFAQTTARYVARDIFLDGNTFKSSHRVDKRNYVGESAFGVAFGHRKLSASINYVHRSRQFEEQIQDHRFGSFTISYGF